MIEQELIDRIINRSFSEDTRHMIDDVDAAWIIKLTREYWIGKCKEAVDKAPERMRPDGHTVLDKSVVITALENVE